MTLPIYGQPGAPTITGPGPVNPPAPEFYPMSFDGLQTVKQYSRASFAKAFGCQLPAFDPRWPAQYWFDPTTDPTKDYEYLTVLQKPGGAFVQPWGVGPATVPGARAVVPNIPGRPTYPARVVAQTNATSDGTNLVNPTVLSTEEEAHALAALLPGTTVVLGPPLTPSPDAEGRCDWMLQGGGLSSAYFVGTLLLDQYAEGIGVPGSWSIANGGALWTPAPKAADGITSGIPRTWVAVPCRALLPDEYIQAGMFGGMVFSR